MFEVWVLRGVFIRGTVRPTSRGIYLPVWFGVLPFYLHDTILAAIANDGPYDRFSDYRARLSQVRFGLCQLLLAYFIFMGNGIVNEEVDKVSVADQCTG